MQKAIVIGCPGSGESTFSKELLHKYAHKRIGIFQDRNEADEFLSQIV